MIDLFWRLITAVLWMIAGGGTAIFVLAACMIQDAENRRKQTEQEVRHAES